MMLRESYDEEKEKIVRAGLIPFILNDGKVNMYVMKPSDPKYGGTKWQIAKGQIDPGENPQKAATREAEEELGLRKSNILELFSVGSYWSNKFHVFGCIVKDPKAFGKPHYETGATAWINWQTWYSEGRREQTKMMSAAYKIAKTKF
jgi:8-oxo-dGTP pyrophosphatase MutT (NUDIX family)